MAGRYLNAVSSLVQPRCSPRLGRTHGLMGSLMVSRKSSILPVDSRIFSRGLGSLVACDGPGPKAFWLPRLYPAVPRICAIAISRVFVCPIPLLTDEFTFEQVREAPESVCQSKGCCSAGSSGGRNLKCRRDVRGQELEQVSNVRASRISFRDNFPLISRLDRLIFGKNHGL